jgi:2-polyprenyl-3-methyl-5-hydroxy-6-metoxy-1,4-benzoquinol methylase
MKEKLNHTTGIKSKQLQSQIASAQIRLYDKFINLDIKSLNISEYNKRYLGGKIAILKNELQLCGRLLYLSLNDSHISPEHFVLVDYGGGSGLISFLAAEMGIGTVIYNDIYDVSCMDVRHLSNTLGLTLDHIVCGDVDELASYLHKNSISINAITSYDVLEHIYDVESHFRNLSCLSDSTFRIIYASGANIANPRYVRHVKKKQIEAEYKNREKKWGHKERDSLRAFLDVRKNMISEYAPDLNFEIVEQLARSTRGLIQRDIEKCVDEFRLQGSITYHIDHPTNTCDPYTGNWCEHLMDFEWLEQILKNEGFSVQIVPGRYNTYEPFLKKSVKVFFNAVIQLFGRWVMFIAPYYVVYADFTEQDVRPCVK